MFQLLIHHWQESQEETTMNKPLIATLLLGALLAIAGIVNANNNRGEAMESMMKSDTLVMGMGSEKGMSMGTMHQTMMPLMNNGTYKDLEELRKTTGMNMMPWIDSEKDFEEMKEHHAKMQEMHKENGMGMMKQGMMGKGCHG